MVRSGCTGIWMIWPGEPLYRLEPELYSQVASAERLRFKVVGWLLRHVRHRDAMTAGPPPVPAGSFRCRAFPRGLPACSLQVTLRSTQWRGSALVGPVFWTSRRAVVSAYAQ